MTIKETVKNMNIAAGSYNIGFNGNDETQLDVTDAEDLESLWLSLCGELDTAPDAVDYVEPAKK